MVNKKAQGISINTIIIAAIALLVLVIVSIIFMVRMGIFSMESNKCSQYQGSCDYGTRCPDDWQKHPTALCYDGNDIDRTSHCCVRAVS